MNLRSYPHDIQKCELKFHSNAFPNNILQFSHPVIKMHPEALESSSLVIAGCETFVQKANNYDKYFSECVFEIFLQRRMEFFLYQVYTPN